MTRHVYGRRGFVCESGTDCANAAAKASADYVEGQLSHVGPHYDMFENGVPWRIVVVGLEAGSHDKHVSLVGRSMAVAGSMEISFRERNSHMRGTTGVLRLAFGREAGEDRSGELLRLRKEPNLHHVFECFALVNKRLCSAPVEGSSDGRTNRAAKVPRMDKACLPHLEATVRILEPTLIVLQSLRLWPLIAPRLHKVRPVKVRGVEPDVAALDRAEFGGVETMIASFSHPAAYGPLNWGNSAGDDYLVKTVAPTITAARKAWFR